MFGFAHGAMLLAPSEDALDHRPARLRHAVPRMPRGSFVDRAVAGLAGFGDGLILRHMRRPAALRLAFSMVSEARRSAVPLACVTLPATASPCRFSMVAWAI